MPIQTEALAAAGLPAHQLRVLEEHAQLSERLSKLMMFLGTPIFATLPQEDKQLLAAQSGAMSAYLGILNLRIGRFGVQS